MSTMDNEKIENLLNLALDATERERDRSLDLSTGYDRAERTWEVIVKYGGTTEELKALLRENFPDQYEQLRFTNLSNEYAILTLPESIITAVASLTEIEYMEKPKRLSFAVADGKRASCITPLQTDAGTGAVTGGAAVPGTGAVTGGTFLSDTNTGTTVIPGRTNLTGRGVLVAVIDSGIDYAHPDFRNPDGTTRILCLWDQTIPGGSVPDPRADLSAAQPPDRTAAPDGAGTATADGQTQTLLTSPGTPSDERTQQDVSPDETGTATVQAQPLLTEPARESDDPGQQNASPGGMLPPPQGYYLGTEFTRDIINLALDQPTERGRNAICPSRDLSGHGTHVTGIAAGNGSASGGRYRGVAFHSDLVIVKLGTPQEDGFPRTTELMQAIDYCLRKAVAFSRPIALNLSFGNSYGSHSGTSLIETYLNDVSNYWRSSILIGSGNEGATAGHTSGTVSAGRTEVVELAVSEYETAFNLQIWKSYADEFAVSIVHPNGTVAGPIQQVLGTQRFTLGTTELLLYYGEPSPYSPYQEIYFDFIPVSDYVDSGIWEIRLLPQRIVRGNYDMWLPSGGVLNEGTGFLYPTENTTLTIPSTAAKAITVAAYDARFNQLASFSGRGYTRETNQIKPDLAAPGVEITSCAPGGGYATRSGTSMATPFVTGSAALMMEWGIQNGNDPYLYGEKLKAYLIRGARPLGGEANDQLQYPNRQIGWGTLCVENSLPM